MTLGCLCDARSLCAVWISDERKCCGLFVDLAAHDDRDVFYRFTGGSTVQNNKEYECSHFPFVLSNVIIFRRPTLFCSNILKKTDMRSPGISGNLTSMVSGTRTARASGYQRSRFL